MTYYAIWIQSNGNDRNFEPRYMQPNGNVYYNKVPRLFDNLASAQRSKQYFDRAGYYEVKIHEVLLTRQN